MAVLPKEFSDYTSALFGEERWKRYLASFDEPVPVSIRMNPFKQGTPPSLSHCPLSKPASWSGEGTGEVPVPWCRNAYYLAERPNFTMDPLLHAGVYYVQEASSMFLDEAIRQIKEKGLIKDDITALDLCAAPGGKSTLLRAALSYDGVSGSLSTVEKSDVNNIGVCGSGGRGRALFSNEPDRRRANILMENLQKQGHPDVIVTNNYPIDYQRAGMQFDFILCDVPCSGEGMFRKDEATTKEWSVQNVRKCAELQRSIVEDIWPCLNDGGIMVYSTCTFNLHEDEENVRWICETLGAEMIPIETKPEWNITGSLLEGWDKPVYRFIPGTTRGEGIFMAVLRKVPSSEPSNQVARNSDTVARNSDTVARNSGKAAKKGGGMLRVISDGRHHEPTIKGKNVIPPHAEALLINLPSDKYPQADLSLEDALKYLHHEAILLPPDVPKGFVIVTYQGHPLGFVKNIGNRANNLYPQEWRIKTHPLPLP